MQNLSNTYQTLKTEFSLTSGLIRRSEKHRLPFDFSFPYRLMKCVSIVIIIIIVHIRKRVFRTESCRTKYTSLTYTHSRANLRVFTTFVKMRNEKTIIFETDLSLSTVERDRRYFTRYDKCALLANRTNGGKTVMKQIKYDTN